MGDVPLQWEQKKRKRKKKKMYTSHCLEKVSLLLFIRLVHFGKGPLSFNYAFN